jgi:hypothetical protein
MDITHRRVAQRSFWVGMGLYMVLIFLYHKFTQAHMEELGPATASSMTSMQLGSMELCIRQHFFV